MPIIPAAKIEKFVSKEESSINLLHVWFDAEGQRLAATNGHVMTVARALAHEGETSGFIPVLAFETIRKMIQRHKKESEFPPEKLITMKAFSDHVVIVNEWTHESYTIQRPSFGEHLKFPNFDAVLPAVIGQPTISLSAAYVASICKEMGDDTGVSFWLQGREQQVLISHGEDAVTVLMPMKIDLEAADVLSGVAPKAVAIPEPVSA